MNIGYNDIKPLEYAIYEHRKHLTEEYGKYVHNDILNLYLPPEKSIIVNDDPDLYPIELKIPEPPEFHKINGFGLPPEKQFFRRPVMPIKLQDLLKTSKSINDVWKKINNNRRLYKKEIEWIQSMWNYRLNGYWFYNNGVPTYIDGFHFYYCGFWEIDSGIPEYRYRDRAFFLFARYCLTTTIAPFFARVRNDNIADGYYHYFADDKEAEIYIQQSGLLTQVEKGYWEIDYGRRICYGFNYPKHRREGATNRGCCINNEIVSRTAKVASVVMSKDGDSAQAAFGEKLVLPLRALKKAAFFFIPNMVTTNLTVKTEQIVFDSLDSARANTNIDNDGLLSTIHPITNTDERKEDGNKYIFVHGDEVGKENPRSPYNLLLRHNVMMKTVAQGNVINGLMINTSTSDDTKGDAGRRYMELCKDSHWHKRNYINGQTGTGLFNLFIPADINFEGFSDRFGNPIVTKPTPEQAAYCKSQFGARENIEQKLKQASTNTENYYNEMRENPLRFRNCFMSSGEDTGFDLMPIINRISELDMNEKLKPRIGNFEWVSGWGSDVTFVDKVDGKFELSYFPDTPNNKIKRGSKVVPANTDKFVAACDPFRFDETRKKRRSKGAGCVYLKRDYIIDPEGTNVEDMQTDRFVCTYSNSVKEVDYKEDMLKMTLFFGCEIFPEMNEEMVYKYFRDSKFSGYLGYLWVDGKKNELPGFYTSLPIKQRIFKLWKMKIESGIGHEKHRGLLQELCDIESLKDMTNYDLFAASGGCLLSMYYCRPELRGDAQEATDMIASWVELNRR